LKNNIYNSLVQHHHQGKKQLAVLIDPDSYEQETDLLNLCTLAEQAGAHLILIGGSLITNGFFDRCVELVKHHCSLPIVLFPGNIMQVNAHADAILFLSLISGRNPDLLIGKHVLAAPQIKASGVEVIPTGYMLVDGGSITSVSYMSNTTPIPADKPAIAATTALAGQMLGLKSIYMDAGSGAQHAIPTTVIQAVKAQTDIPIFVGGGIRTSKQVIDACAAGADIVVIGNAFENDPHLIKEMTQALEQFNHAVNKSA
jgi:putative glycerol-1-phosphate prenyltransferase